MTTTPQDSFLRQASAAARAAGHIFPDYAACEAALESTWGRSRLAREANNLFGQKQSAEHANRHRHDRHTHAGIPQRPLGHRHRAMGPLRRSGSLLPCPHGARSTASSRAIPPTPAHSPPPPAKSSSKRSHAPGPTDPQRAAKVLAIHRQHCASFLPLAPPNLASRPTAAVMPV